LTLANLIKALKSLLDRIGDAFMLETPQERVRLLKAGIDGKTIERLYIIYNNLKIVNFPLLFELVEINLEENENSAITKRQNDNHKHKKKKCIN